MKRVSFGTLRNMLWAPAPAAKDTAAKFTVEDNGRIRLDHTQYLRCMAVSSIARLVLQDGKAALLYRQVDIGDTSSPELDCRNVKATAKGALFVRAGKIFYDKHFELPSGEKPQIIFCDHKALNAPVGDAIAAAVPNKALLTLPAAVPRREILGLPALGPDNRLAFQPGHTYSVDAVRAILPLAELEYVDVTMNAGGSRNFTYEPTGRGMMRISRVIAPER